MRTSKFNRWVASRRALAADLVALDASVKQNSDAYAAAADRAFEALRAAVRRCADDEAEQYSKLTAEGVRLTKLADSYAESKKRELDDVRVDDATAGPAVREFASRERDAIEGRYREKFKTLNALREKNDDEAGKLGAEIDECRAALEVSDRSAFMRSCLDTGSFARVRERFAALYAELVAVYETVTRYASEVEQRRKEVEKNSDALRPRSFTVGDYRFVPRCDERSDDGRRIADGAGLFFVTHTASAVVLTVQQLLALRDWIDEVYTLPPAEG